jgi:hypothetical protein
MFRENSFLLCGLFAMSCAMLSAAEDKAPVTVLIQCKQTVVKSGSEVKLLVTVTNTSDQDLDLYKTPGPDGQAENVNKVEVRDESGNILPRADVQTVNIGGKLRTFPKKIAISRAGVTLKPGESLEDFTILGNLFDLSKPGKYAVTVQNERRSGDSGHELKLIYVKSNTITITVTE